MKRYKKTVIGLSIIILIFLISCLYPLFGPEDYNKQPYIRNEQGKVIDRAPFPPSKDHLLGTDRNGQDVFLIVIDGAKYTILTAFIVTIVRVIFGGLIGIIISFWLPKLKVYFNDFFLGFKYVPSTIIALLLMAPVTIRYTGVPFSAIISYQLFVLFLVAFPSIVSTTMDLMDDLKKNTFIQSSYLMGGSHLHVLRKHMKPYLKSFGLLIGIQQMISMLVILMHLGIFGVFLGGPTKSGIFNGDMWGPKTPESLSSEWSGLIGQNFAVILQYPWIVLSTILCFFFLICLLNMMKKELESQINHGHSIEKKDKADEKPIHSKSKFSISSFTFVNEKNLRNKGKSVG
jgi:peptide/nickel transport system permease protein